jgi:hypothetical protein
MAFPEIISLVIGIISLGWVTYKKNLIARSQYWPSTTGSIMSSQKITGVRYKLNSNIWGYLHLPDVYYLVVDLPCQSGTCT